MTSKEHYLKYKDIYRIRAKKYYQLHKDHVKKRMKIYRLKNLKLIRKKDKIRSRLRAVSIEDKKYKHAYYMKNKEKILEYQKEYAQKHQTKIALRAKKWRMKNRILLTKKRQFKLKNNVDYKLIHILRGRIHRAIINNWKRTSTIELLGTDLLTVRKHIESQFKEDMSWQNHGSIWHIDHIRPCASFDLNRIYEQKRCFNYKNLQPLYILENLRKGIT